MYTRWLASLARTWLDSQIDLCIALLNRKPVCLATGSTIQSPNNDTENVESKEELDNDDNAELIGDAEISEYVDVDLPVVG